jgi:SAM-dependent methyltransferase
MRTDDARYTERLTRLESVWWKRWLDVQRPYRWHLRRLRLGFVLDVGCGTGRNLINLGGAGAGVGVDHNPASVAAARARGLEAYVPEELASSPHGSGGRFDSLLVSHVLEHMTRAEATALLARYLPHVKRGGQVVLITPQEAGFRSDDTHVAFTDLDALAEIARDSGLEIARRYSFPFPRSFGRVFKYNEFVLIARVP